MTRMPWEEPSAGKPHARICGGEAEWPSLATRPSPTAAPRPLWRINRLPGYLFTAK